MNIPYVFAGLAGFFLFGIPGALVAVVVMYWIKGESRAALSGFPQPRPARTDTGTSSAEYIEGTDYLAVTRRRWATALSIEDDEVDFDAIEEQAYAAGAPDDWERLGWPTPCGPRDQPRRYCLDG